MIPAMSMSDNNNQPETNTVIRINSQSLPIIITLFFLVFFFFGFITIYCCRCMMEYLTGEGGVFRRRNGITSDNAVGGRTGMHGLDPEIIASFPTFEYSKVKDLREDKGGTLECAVCISEFQDDDILRLLTVCNHAFHPDCIDLWLSSHTTCPVCRRDLSDPWENSPDKSGEISITISNQIEETDQDDSRNDNDSRSDTRRVSFKDEDVMIVNRTNEGSMSAYVEASGGEHATERFSRSHSTGHSILRGDHERYTLRLPEHVKKRFAKRHIVTNSCTTFGDFSGDVTIEKNGLAEVSGADHAIKV